MFEKSELEVRLDQLEEVVFLRLERLEKIVKTKEAKSAAQVEAAITVKDHACLLYTSPSPRDKRQSRMPSSA